MTKNKLDYKLAGVDINAGNEAVDLIKDSVKSTFSKNVLIGLGGFGALYDLKSIIKKYEHPVLVQSIDGVGTKTIIARKLNKYDTIGIDLLSAAANDIIVMGARPVTFLDYIANDKLKPSVIKEIISGMVMACKNSNVSLIGGETAEMPDTYLPGEHDLVGVITGLVEKDKIISGGLISAGDVVLPKNCIAIINKDAWNVLPVFNAIQSIGSIDESEMFRTFNMGIGMICIVSSDDVSSIKQLISVREIGEIVSGDGGVKVV